MEKLVVVKVTNNGDDRTYYFPESFTLEQIEQIIGSVPQDVIDQYNADQIVISEYADLPDWLKTWTAIDASTYIHTNVLNGFEHLDVDNYVANLPNTIAGMKTGLTQIGYALIDIRNILEIIARLLMNIRDLVIKYRHGN